VHVSQGSMQDGQIIAFVNYLTTTLFSLMMVSQMVIQLARAEASAQRIQEILDSQPTVREQPSARQDIEIHGRVTFENVSFAYNSSSGDPVLKGINFQAEPGEIVAILGTTGAGKSSLVNLIARFYDVSDGRVLIDEVDVRNIKLDHLRSSIGIALQETVLFSGSIRDNIRYGRPEASNEEVVAAAKAAQIHDFIADMSEGYDTKLGQRGVNLSGGQKQRIAIARAILMRPIILILDDSTSSVDVETESKIQTALEDIMRARTCIIIAQRITTVMKANKILVMDEGQITAQGTHQQLMTSSPIYRDIFESQLGNGEVNHD
jgi:ATP-binding cassette subfamily B multidrug efflux pump